MSDLKLLAVDTCFGACSTAVLAGASLLAAHRVEMARGHAEALAPMVEAVMAAAGLCFAELDKLVVTTGPGSFTGQRVGLAFMRGLRLGLAKPLVGVTSLAAMIAEARHVTGRAIAAAVHDAKRGEVYLELNGHPAQLMSIGDATTLLSSFRELALAGTAASAFADACPDATVTPITAPDAVWVGRLGLDEIETGIPRPLYLRAPDAKLPGGVYT